MAHTTRRSRAAERRSEADTRTRLVLAARDVFLEGGVAGFSLREVARRAGVSAAGVYRHFDGKEALISAACAQGFALFSSYLVRALEAPDALARLLATGEQYRLFAKENPQDYRFIFMTSTDELQAGQPASDRHKLPPSAPGSTFRFLVDRVRECVEARVLSKGDAERVALQIWAHVHGLVSLRLSGQLSALGDDAAFAAFYRESVGGLLRGHGR